MVTYNESMGAERENGEERIILAVSNSYEKKYYLNPNFDRLPENIKDEIKAMMVVCTAESGGIMILEFDEDGELYFRTEADEDDIMYDDISAGMYIKKMQYERRELLEALQMFYRVFILKQDVDIT